MLFLLRPRQTWMPYALPRSRANQEEHNRVLQEAYGASFRVAPAASTPETAVDDSPVADLKELGQLHQSGVLTDAEFAAAKAKLLGSGTSST
jgi:putative oligomerization/nucleic acid binding protein